MEGHIHFSTLAVIQWLSHALVVEDQYLTQLLELTPRWSIMAPHLSCRHSALSNLFHCAPLTPHRRRALPYYAVTHAAKALPLSRLEQLTFIHCDHKNSVWRNCKTRNIFSALKREGSGLVATAEEQQARELEGSCMAQDALHVIGPYGTVPLLRGSPAHYHYIRRTYFLKSNCVILFPTGL